MTFQGDLPLVGTNKTLLVYSIMHQQILLNGNIQENSGSQFFFSEEISIQLSTPGQDILCFFTSRITIFIYVMLCTPPLCIKKKKSYFIHLSKKCPLTHLDPFGFQKLSIKFSERLSLERKDYRFFSRSIFFTQCERTTGIPMGTGRVHFGPSHKMSIVPWASLSVLCHMLLHFTSTENL